MIQIEIDHDTAEALVASTLRHQIGQIQARLDKRNTLASEGLFDEDIDFLRNLMVVHNYYCLPEDMYDVSNSVSA